MIIKRDTTNNKNTKNDDDKVSKIFRYIIFILFMIIMLIIIVTNIKENNDIKELESKEEQEEERQQNLRTCYRTAESDRKSLWKSNCPDDNPNCSLSPNIVEWIDNRYEQDIENCNSLYK